MSKRKKEVLTFEKSRQMKYHSILLVCILLSVIISLIFNVFILNYFMSRPLKGETIVQENIITYEYKNVVFLGDSIVEVYDLDEYYKNAEYVLINSGRSGNTTEDILKELKKRAIQYKPSKIFLLIGTNDIGFGVKSEKTIENIEKILDNLQKECAETEVYVLSIYPVNADIEKSKAGKRTNEAIKRINEEMEKLASAYDSKYIDMYSVLSDEDDNLQREYTTDGLHLSKEGYEVVTSILREYLD